MGKIWMLALFVAAAAAAQAYAAPTVRWRTIQDARRGVYEISAVYPAFSGDSPVAMLANREYRRAAEQAAADVRAAAASDARSRGKLIGPYALDFKTQLSHVGDRLLSGYVTDYRFTGGAHPNTRYVPMNFGLVNGKAKKLVLKDLLLPGAAPAKFAADVVLPELNKAKRGRGVDTISSLDPKLLDQFIVTQNGITFLFSAYDVGPYVEGAYQVKVPWSRLKGSLRTDGPLRSLPAEEGARGSITLRGAVTYRERIALPPGVSVMAVYRVAAVPVPGAERTLPVLRAG